MIIKSYTFQSDLAFSEKTLTDLQKEASQFFKSLKEQKLQVLGCLQSFTFPSSYSEDQSVTVAECVSQIYRTENCVLLGGDTSSGASLAITLIALAQEA